MVKQRVSYFYDTDVGHFYYGPGHPMKPHRIKMAHHLILSTGLYRKLDVYRPHLAAPLEMTRFHSDDYVKFLSKVSPESTRPFLQQMAQFNVGECTDCPVRSRRPVVLWFSLHSNDSCPSHDDVGGFFFDFEAVRTEYAPRRSSTARRSTRGWPKYC